MRLARLPIFEGDPFSAASHRKSFADVRSDREAVLAKGFRPRGLALVDEV
jgi:hypothetical protein